MNSDQIRSRRQELEQQLVEAREIQPMFPSDTTKEDVQSQIFGEMQQLAQDCDHAECTPEDVVCPTCKGLARS